MNIQELLQFHEEICKRARDIMAVKNHDYAGADGTTPFANFEVVEKVGIASTEKGFLVRMQDKMMRLSTYANSGELKVPGEGVKDACLDLMNYAVLFAAYVQDKQKNASNGGFKWGALGFPDPPKGTTPLA